MSEEYLLDIQYMDFDPEFENKILQRAKEQLEFTETLQKASLLMNQIGENCSTMNMHLGQMKDILSKFDKDNTICHQIEKFGQMIKTIGTQFLSQAKFSVQALPTVIFPAIQKLTADLCEATTNYETALDNFSTLEVKSSREECLQSENIFVKSAIRKSGILFSLNHQVEIAEQTVTSSIKLSMTQFLVLAGEMMGDYLKINSPALSAMKTNCDSLKTSIKAWLGRDLNQNPSDNYATRASTNYWDMRFIPNARIINSLTYPNQTVWLKEAHPIRSSSWIKGKLIFEDSLLKFERRNAETDHETKTWPLPLVTVTKVEKGRRFALKIRSPQETIEFQTLSKLDQEEWMHIFNNHNLSVLGENDGQRKGLICADCGATDATWVSLNWAAPLCLRCSGFHRQMSSTNSKVRSFTLDKINPIALHMIDELQGECNKLLLDKHPDISINANSDEKDREDYINRKYINNEWSITGIVPDPFEAIKKRDLKMLFYSVHFGRINETKDSITPFHAVCSLGWEDAVALLAFCVNDLNAKDKDGWTPLCYAVFYQHVNIIDFLLSVGARARNLDINLYQLAIATKNKKVAKSIMMQADQLRNNETEFKPCNYLFAPPGTPENYMIALKSRV